MCWLTTSCCWPPKPPTLVCECGRAAAGCYGVMAWSSSRRGMQHCRWYRAVCKVTLSCKQTTAGLGPAPWQLTMLSSTPSTLPSALAF